MKKSKLVFISLLIASNIWTQKRMDWQEFDSVKINLFDLNSLTHFIYEINENNIHIYSFNNKFKGYDYFDKNIRVDSIIDQCTFYLNYFFIQKSAIEVSVKPRITESNFDDVTLKFSFYKDGILLCTEKYMIENSYFEIEYSEQFLNFFNFLDDLTQKE